MEKNCDDTTYRLIFCNVSFNSKQNCKHIPLQNTTYATSCNSISLDINSNYNLKGTAMIIINALHNGCLLMNKINDTNNDNNDCIIIFHGTTTYRIYNHGIGK